MGLARVSQERRLLFMRGSAWRPRQEEIARTRTHRRRDYIGRVWAGHDRRWETWLTCGLMVAATQGMGRAISETSQGRGEAARRCWVGLVAGPRGWKLGQVHRGTEAGRGRGSGPRGEEAEGKEERAGRLREGARPSSQIEEKTIFFQFPNPFPFGFQN